MKELEPLEYYVQFRRENNLTVKWGIYTLEVGGFSDLHSWQGAEILVYRDVTVKIPGPTWGDLYRAADEVVHLSGRDTYVFVRGFGRYNDDGTQIELTTGI
jgi:hypothetical protein